MTRFFTGLVTQRSPLNTPFTYAGLNMIQRNDALIDGLNVEISNNYTLQRRGGFPRFCSQQLGLSEHPVSFYSARINGQVIDFVDTNLAVYTFTSTTLTLLFTKSAGAGQTFFHAQGNVVYFANGVDNKKWAPPKTTWAASTAFALGTLIIDANGNVQQVTIAGTSGGSLPGWSTTPITGTTVDGGVTWTNRGNQVSNWGIVAPTTAPPVAPTLAAGGNTRFWAANSTYTGTNYTIVDINGNVQLTSAGGTSGATVPIWNTQLAATTADGTVTWVNFGPISGWQPSTKYLQVGPVAAVLDRNNKLEHVNLGGTSGTSEPTWSALLGSSTVDGTVTWDNDGPGNFLAFAGYQWVYAYHTCFGHVSTASPVTINTGPIIGGTFSFPLSGTGSADAQCDYIWIFRIRDGGGEFEFAGQVANPGNATWNFTDATVDASLNDQLLAAQANLNDPPPAGLTVIAYHMRRMWGGVGNTMQFGVGSDRVIGVAEECWPPANSEPFANTVQQFAPTSQGLCILTSDEWWVEMGGPQTLSFYPQRVLDNFGISSPNCLAQDGDQIFLYTTAKQLWSLSLQQGKEEDGWNVGDILAANFDPSKTYISIHRNGTDVGLFMSDGSTNVLRYSLALNAWGTLYQPVGGVGAIGSVETSIGTHTLMAGRPSTSLGGYLLGRSLTNFVDDQSSTYPWNVQLGSIHFSQPGTPAEDLAAIVVQTTTAGTVPTIGVRLNEISGNFVNIPVTADDLYDAPSLTINSKRYDLEGVQQMLPNQIRHMQLQISGVAANTKDEILGIHFCPQVG